MVTIVCGASARTTPEELDALLALGAGEVYVGYVPPGWLAALGMEVSPNRRYVLERQVHDPAHLARLGEAVRARGAGFVVALNEHVYAPDVRARLPEIVAAGLAAGATGFIVADPSLLAELPADRERIVSCEAGTYNISIARSFVEAGATRLIFPRELRLDEMAAIARSVGPTVGLEAFAAREYCVNSSAVCFATHGYGQRAHFCCAATRETLVELGGGPARVLPAGPPAWSTEPDFLRAVVTLHRCGFCGIGTLLAAGVGYLKLPGRSDSALPALRLLSQLLDGGDLAPEACRRLVASPAFCASGEYCYYRAREGGPPLLGARRAIAADRPRAVRAPVAELRSASSSTTRIPCATYLLVRLRGIPAVSSPGIPACLAGAGASMRDRLLACAEPPPVPTSRAPRPVLAPAATPELAAYLSVGPGLDDALADLRRAGVRGLLADAGAAQEEAAARRGIAFLEERGVPTDTAPPRVYLGLELCALRLPSPEGLAAAVSAVRAAGFAPTLVAPVAFEAHWDSLVRALERALAVAGAEAELVVSDLGLLRHAARVGWPSLAVGRIFNRMKRDVFAADPDVLPAPEGLPLDDDPAGDRARRTALRAAQDAANGHPYLGDPFYAELLARHGVVRIETDVLTTPLTAPLAAGFAHALHLPWSYVTSSRACRVAAAVEGARRSQPTEACRRSCERHAVVADFPWRHRPIVQSGTATLLDASEDARAFWASARPGFGRVVFSARRPR